MKTIGLWTDEIQTQNLAKMDGNASRSESEDEQYRRAWYIETGLSVILIRSSGLNDWSVFPRQPIASLFGFERYHYP